MTQTLILWSLFAFVLSFLGTVGAKLIARRYGIIDAAGPYRKIHRGAIPLLGGTAIFVSLAIIVILLLATGDALTGGEITKMHYAGFLLGGLILMIGGVLDDKFTLPPRASIIAPILAALVAIGFGIEVDKLTNPFGGVIELASWQSDLLVFGWLMAVMYTTKFLDGLDGLASGVSMIGALMIMFLSLSVAYYQPDVALLSAVALGALLGFLLWNMHPAMIFLGEGGSTFVGYLVGVLAVISGGKLATALLVLGIPFLDVVWVILRRWRTHGFRGIFKGDRKHLHHRLLDLGWSQRTITFGYIAVATTFGIVALFLQSREKLVALGMLGILMVLLSLWLTRTPRKNLL